MKRQLVLIVAILAAWLGAVATATAAASVPTNLDVIYAHTYGGDHHSSPETGGTTQRGLRTHSQTLTTAYAYDAVDRSWYGRSARPESDHAGAAATYTTVDTALYWAGSITTTREQAARSDGDLSPLAPGRVAAKTESGISRLLGGRVRDERGSLSIWGGKSYDPDQQALIQLAKDAKRRGGLPQDEANTLADWADEFGLPGHGPMTHPRPGWSGTNIHINIGPIKHILVR